MAFLLLDKRTPPSPSLYIAFFAGMVAATARGVRSAPSEFNNPTCALRTWNIRRARLACTDAADL